MTDGPKQDGEESPRSHDHQESGPVMHEDLPDILEIFGSDPLVKGEARSPAPDSMEPGDDVAWPNPDRHPSDEASSAQDEEDEVEDESEDDDSIWDPMASPREEAVDEAAPDVGELTPRASGNGKSSSATSLATTRRLGEMRDILQLNEDRLGRLEATIQDLSKQTNFLPPKLRGLGKKVDELSTSLGDTRLRSLLADVVGLGDLAEGALAALPAPDQGSKGPDVRRFFHAMATRVGQILESYDLQEIPTDVDFDPTVHNAIDVEDVNDEALDGQIIEVVRRGYRGEHSVLRYAEVTVGRYSADAKSETETETEPEATNDSQPAAPEAAEAVAMTSDGISATYAPFLGASGTAEDSKKLTKRGTRRPTEGNETKDDKVDSESGVEPPSA